MEVLNQEKIDRLSGEIGAENVPVLLDIFLGELNTYLDSLSSNETPNKGQYLREISHALKSSAASFGAERLCAYASEVDAAAKAGKPHIESTYVVPMIELLETTKSRYQQLVN
ncbi:two-component system, phosphorelay protein LuxU [Vibrio xiamenensis]|uniref:Phosphorelay protein LuxU n=1 Tax=Vibrio xiamenensis TaxID=861298 RepID=A0A1G8F7K3_9VIBR|nr:quorum-sensing phosphorelay protein LuxU [Vibrio xiamenensis]SDH78088.1 two-component system, phosphorelay protein LuxU [Vibrio xiamenensis]